MSHGDHGGHGGHDMPMPSGPTCSMNMLWNTQVEDTCVVFRSWHISGPLALALSCVAIAGLGVLYEYTRVASARLDRRIAATLSAQGKGKASTAVGAAAVSASSREPEDELDSEEAGLLTRSSVVKARGA